MSDVAVAPPPADLVERHQPAGAQDLRTRLRAATASEHARIDRAFAPLNLQDLGDYRNFLERSAAALIPIETSLAAAGIASVLPDWPQRARTRAILADLAALDGRIALLAAPARLDRAAMLGAAYVLEGSRLGARMLLRQVEQSSDLRVQGATEYLRHGIDRRFWQSFLARLQTLGPECDERRVIAGARDTFGLFQRAAESLQACRRPPGEAPRT